MVNADGRIMRHAAVIPHSVVSKKGASLEGNPPSWKPRYVAEGFGNRKAGRRCSLAQPVGGSRDSPPFVPKSSARREAAFSQVRPAWGLPVQATPLYVLQCLYVLEMFCQQLRQPLIPPASLLLNGRV